MAAEHDDGELGFAVLEGEIDMAGGGGAAVGDFTFDPEVGIGVFDVLTDVADQGSDGPDATLDGWIDGDGGGLSASVGSSGWLGRLDRLTRDWRGFGDDFRGGGGCGGCGIRRKEQTRLRGARSRPTRVKTCQRGRILFPVGHTDLSLASRGGAVVLLTKAVDDPQDETEHDAEQNRRGKGEGDGPAAAPPVEVSREPTDGEIQAVEAEQKQTSDEAQGSDEDEKAGQVIHLVGETTRYPVWRRLLARALPGGTVW